MTGELIGGNAGAALRTGFGSEILTALALY